MAQERSIPTQNDARREHPLLPGIRTAEVLDRNWPRMYHDKQLTAFSPLVCGMTTAPEVWASIDVGGELTWIREVRTVTGDTRLLVYDGSLRLVSLEGDVIWTRGAGGHFAHFGPLRGTQHDYLLLTSGRHLILVDAASGETDWRGEFGPAHVYLRVAVGDVLPDSPGPEAVVFQQYGEEGCLLDFPAAGEPTYVWRRQVVETGEHPERADHRCEIHLDVSVPEQPVVWNIRHHRCRGFDARTGAELSALVYRLGGGHRRNYGPSALGRSADGEPLLCVVGEAIQQHVHALRLRRDAPNELAWQRYYGEVYVTPGVAVQKVIIADVNADGATEIVYNVRDPQQDLKSFLRVLDAGTGESRAELPGLWALAAVEGTGERARALLLARPAGPDGPPLSTELRVMRFSALAVPTEIARFSNARPFGMVSAADALTLVVTDEDGKASVRRYAVTATELMEEARSDAERLLTGAVRLTVPGLDHDPPRFVLTGGSGTLECLDWQGEPVWELPLSGGRAPTLSAVDLDGDGRAELVAATAGDRARVFRLGRDGAAEPLWSCEFCGDRRASPLLYDLRGDGTLCLIAPGRSVDGKVCARAFDSRGERLWETIFENMSTADGGQVVGWNAGAFLPGPRSGVAISVSNRSRTREGTYLLDGASGRVLWEKRLHKDGAVVRSYRPLGIPTAFDIDGDGLEEIGMDLSSYMAFLNGADGSFAFLRHTPNIRAENALYAALLYNSFCPVYRTPDAESPHWFVPLGHGRFGLMNPDPSTGPWRVVAGYDVPTKVGLIDVDGDGELEVGYALRNSRTFVCRSLWTGEVKWELELPSAVSGPVLVADVDGDGKGEFLVGFYCLGTDAEAKGELRWRAPVYLGSAIIADLDGDGVGEIAVASAGRITILRRSAP